MPERQITVFLVDDKLLEQAQITGSDATVDSYRLVEAGT